MPKPAAAAVSQQLRLQCLQRLQHLQTQFLHIDSPAELADAEQEGGHILATFVFHRLSGFGNLTPSGEYSQGLLRHFSELALSNLLPSGIPATNLEGYPRDGGRANWYTLKVWEYARQFSSSQRIVLRPVGFGPMRMGYSDLDYKQQGKRYSLFVSELIAKLSTDQTTSRPTTTSSHSIEKRPFTEGELVDALLELLNRASQYYTAGQVRQRLMERYPDKTVGETAIKDHPIWKQHAKDWGKDRAPRNTSRQAEKAIRDKLIAQQKRTEQQTSYRGVDRIADGD